jgi:hypothetical protein
MKKNVMIRIDAEIAKKAKEVGLNISKVSENALKEMIERIESPKVPNNPKNRPDNSNLVGLPGFEPGSRAPEACGVPVQ